MSGFVNNNSNDENNNSNDDKNSQIDSDTHDSLKDPVIYLPTDINGIIFSSCSCTDLIAMNNVSSCWSREIFELDLWRKRLSNYEKINFDKWLSDIIFYECKMRVEFINKGDRNKSIILDKILTNYLNNGFIYKFYFDIQSRIRNMMKETTYSINPTYLKSTPILIDKVGFHYNFISLNIGNFILAYNDISSELIIYDNNLNKFQGYNLSMAHTSYLNRVSSKDFALRMVDWKMTKIKTNKDNIFIMHNTGVTIVSLDVVESSLLNYNYNHINNINHNYYIKKLPISNFEIAIKTIVSTYLNTLPWRLNSLLPNYYRLDFPFVSDFIFDEHKNKILLFSNLESVEVVQIKIDGNGQFIGQITIPKLPPLLAPWNETKDMLIHNRVLRIDDRLNEAIIFSCIGQMITFKILDLKTGEIQDESKFSDLQNFFRDCTIENIALESDDNYCGFRSRVHVSMSDQIQDNCEETTDIRIVFKFSTNNQPELSKILVTSLKLDNPENGICTIINVSTEVYDLPRLSSSSVTSNFNYCGPVIGLQNITLRNFRGNSNFFALFRNIMYEFHADIENNIYPLTIGRIDNEGKVSFKIWVINTDAADLQKRKFSYSVVSFNLKEDIILFLKLEEISKKCNAKSEGKNSVEMYKISTGEHLASIGSRSNWKLNEPYLYDHIGTQVYRMQMSQLQLGVDKNRIYHVPTSDSSSRKNKINFIDFSEISFRSKMNQFHYIRRESSI